MILKVKVWSEKGGLSQAKETTYAKMLKVEYSLFRESSPVLARLELEFKGLLYLCLVLVVNIR